MFLPRVIVVFIAAILALPLGKDNTGIVKQGFVPRTRRSAFGIARSATPAVRR
jgi:hypothetical protein